MCHLPVIYRSSKQIPEQDWAGDGEVSAWMYQAVCGQTHPQTQTQGDQLQARVFLKNNAKKSVTSLSASKLKFKNINY